MLTTYRIGPGLGSLEPSDYSCSASGVCTGRNYAAIDKLTRFQRELIAWGAGITADGKIGTQTLAAFKSIVPAAVKKMPLPVSISGLGTMDTTARLTRFADELRAWLAAARVYVAPVPAPMIATTPTITTTKPPVRLPEKVVQMTRRDLTPEPTRYGWWVAGGLGLAAVIGLFAFSGNR